MKMNDIITKSKELCKKAGIRTLIAACAVLILGGIITINIILSGEEDKPTSGLAVDLSKGAEDQELNPSEVEDYFASISLQRKQARDEAKEVLMSVAESTTALEDAKKAALDDINRLALEIEMEANIETLVLSKGFEQCIAVINNDKCNIIVETAGLMPGEVAQISEIVYEQSGILPANLKIIEKDPG